MTPAPLKVGRPSFAGNSTRLKVGRASYGLPPGSRVVHPSGAKKLAYALLHDQSVHAFVERGEVELTPELQALIRRKFFSTKQEFGTG